MTSAGVCMTDRIEPANAKQMIAPAIPRTVEIKSDVRTASRREVCFLAPKYCAARTAAPPANPM